MMDWTDRHCRYLHRLLSGCALLYTEMVTAPALVRGGAVHLLEFDPAEHPVALQLGGSDADELGAATRLGAARGYDEVNLNLGCPSDRVQSGAFGAVLMRDPELVERLVGAMLENAGGAEITVKCRIGVDEQEPEEVLPDLIARLRALGLRRMTIHARKAWLDGLSPKENRDIPPLDYPLVQAMKREFPDMHLSINGGIRTLAEAQAQLAAGLDGVMVGRAAYHDPGAVLVGADRAIWGEAGGRTALEAARDMLPYIERHIAAGGRMQEVTRHMLGLFTGRPGARAYRRILSEEARLPGAGPEVLERAIEAVDHG